MFAFATDHHTFGTRVIVGLGRFSGFAAHISTNIAHAILNWALYIYNVNVSRLEKSKRLVCDFIT